MDLKEEILKKAEFICENDASELGDSVHGIKTFIKNLEVTEQLLIEVKKIVDYYYDELYYEKQEKEKTIFSKLPPMCIFSIDDMKYVKVGNLSYNHDGTEAYINPSSKCKFINYLF